MKYVVVLILAVIIVLSATAATTIQPGPARIQLTSVLLERKEAAGVSRAYALYNRPAYPNRIGTGVQRCLSVSKGWLDCTYMLRLSHGVIVARALVPSAASFRLLAVLGGSGLYSNVGGEMTVQPLGNGQLIIVNLLGFS